MRPLAQLCGPAVHDPREAGGSLVSRLGSEGGFFLQPQSVLNAIILQRGKRIYMCIYNQYMKELI